MNKINEHSLIYETVPLEKTGINLLITVYSSLNGTETRTGSNWPRGTNFHLFSINVALNLCKIFTWSAGGGI